MEMRVRSQIGFAGPGRGLADVKGESQRLRWLKPAFQFQQLVQAAVNVADDVEWTVVVLANDHVPL